MKNLLVVSFWCPDPPDNGSRLRARHLISELERNGYKIRLLALAQEETDLKSAQRNLDAVCSRGATLFPARFFRPSTARALIGFFTPQPRHLLDTHQADFAEAVHRECCSGEHDAILALELGAAHYVPATMKIPAVMDQLEVSPFVNAVREASSARSRIRRSLTLYKLRVHLRTLAHRYALWTVVSEAEAQAVRSLVGTNTPPLQVLPNGVDLERNRPDPQNVYDPNFLVYNGSPTFWANAEAVRWFAQMILPMIQQSRPDVCLRVTGRSESLAPDDILHRTPGVTLTGFLDDVRPTVRGAAACVVPIRQGGGTRLKILEAMALGVPVVSTTRGAEGLGTTEGVNILIADEPVAFAAATLRLMDDQTLRMTLGAEGRKLVESRYGWESLVAPLDGAIESLTKQEKQSCL
jgi:glycosyltransferase involved in cell wall biosynthesis